MKIMVILFLLISFLGCERRAEISPPYVRLERDGVGLIIAGTYHYTTEEIFREYERSKNPVFDSIRSSDVFFSEYGPEILTKAEGVVMQSIIRPEDGRPSVQTLIDAWETERREIFLANLNRFPELNHVGRQQILLSQRPFASYDFIRSTIFPLVTGIPRGYSVDRLYTEIAEAHNLSHLGLQSIHEVLVLMDTINQESILEYLEFVVNLNPTAQMLVEAQNKTLQQMHGSYITGHLDFSETGFYSHLGADDSVLNNLRSYNSFAEDVLYRQREETWVETIGQYINLNPDHKQLFLAVGYGHLGHPDARLLQLLEQEGWVVAQVGFSVVQN